MRDPLSRDFSALEPAQDSWIHRVRENFHQVLTPADIFPSSANGAPLHLLRFDKSSRANRAQSVSFLIHVTVIVTLALIAIHPPTYGDRLHNPSSKFFQHITLPSHFLLTSNVAAPDPGAGSGGGRVPIPTTTGDLLPTSSLQLVRPSLPPKQEINMPVPPSILDPATAPILTSVNKIGLPWMKDETGSPGPGDSDTIGDSSGRTMGDGPRDGPGGQGVSESRYHAGVTPPRCAYCPDPQYTDEAREAKLQGKVTLRVLVGADGRAAQVHIVQGIGLGLDERAAQAIRGWKFVVAQDAGRRPVPAWITVEAIFRLF